MQITHSATRWCHLTCATIGRHKFFNIPAHARFCERVLAQECDRLGWPCETAILPDRLHALVLAPARTGRAEIARLVRRAASRAAWKTGVAPHGQRVWDRNCWCAVISGPAVDAVRRRLRALSAPAGAAQESAAEHLVD